ncbi:hypothetical protein VFPPC_15952 [Pochonia chlamydosporia 170]|uniref:Uncharacterized protein n=1 Tax=Pochonia chlamydosporia 170 TaxID=1380566 RepID=A0A179FJL9_METCM|nr:hypothetical protein VFPPC_15952 [Pochonia chlamydosporia 170]OAQ65825.1 hypothetical protein VFPPC_15952 [Pochonia chlamydosporia 170]
MILSSWISTWCCEVQVNVPVDHSQIETSAVCDGFGFVNEKVACLFAFSDK